jgi:hypothetical protein
VIYENIRPFVPRCMKKKKERLNALLDRSYLPTVHLYYSKLTRWRMKRRKESEIQWTKLWGVKKISFQSYKIWNYFNSVFSPYSLIVYVQQVYYGFIPVLRFLISWQYQPIVGILFNVRSDYTIRFINEFTSSFMKNHFRSYQWQFLFYRN